MLDARLTLTFLPLLLVLVFFVKPELVLAQTNVTLDDTDIFITYSPATSWHANTVACDTCLQPLNSTAHSGTYHTGEHVIPTADEDDEGTVGDTDGDGTTTSTSTSTISSSSSSSQSSSTLPTSAISSAAPVQSSESTNDDDDDDDGGKKGGSGKGSKRSLPQGVRDETNPFETEGGDSDDPGFVDTPVTASINFTGTGIYVFAIVPLFPAPPDTTPTTTNLSFSLDGISSGRFLHVPDSNDPNTPTVNSSTSDKFLPNVNVFAVTGLEDTDHGLVIDVGVDSVLLFDYLMYTAGPNDPTGTDGAIGSQRTSGSSAVDSTTSQHNVKTFAGAIGGSVGVLSVLALGLCFSIRLRRHRAHVRERRQRLAIAEPITSWDHGEDGPEGEEHDTFGQLRNTEQPMMSQAAPAPFVPRYFPGSTPASPPPYNATAPSVPVQPLSPLGVSITRSGNPISVPSSMPPTISSPAAALNLYRTGSNNSYADRPPPTPSSEEARFVFGVDPEDADRVSVRTGGILAPPPPDSPVADESDPMLDDSGEHEFEPRAEYRDDFEEQPGYAASTRRSSVKSSTSFTQSSGSDRAGPSTSIDSSAAQVRRASSFSLTTSTEPTSLSSSDSGPSTPSKRSSIIDPRHAHTLSNASSLPNLISVPTPRRSFPPSSRDLLELLPLEPIEPMSTLQQVTTIDQRMPIAYPLLHPSRIPLPSSAAVSTNVSQESLSRHDSRT